ncbi:MAG: histidine kinase, partial [Chlorobium phaeobacteroides]|nr:histidine kinase [Chlorobium phaeobacteroides]
MVKNIVTNSVLLLILCILQQYAFSRLVIFGAMPDIVTIFVAFTAL